MLKKKKIEADHIQQKFCIRSLWFRHIHPLIYL